MQMHVYMIDGHKNSQQTEDQRRPELIVKSMLNTVILAVSETVSR